ncbi:DUF2490 domain-containing protein [Gemmatimonas sp.]|jgi:hypothetical protein|uniref:DUF2490 domain-containing protein n=1 Tax=Gemmatimonas sp. TaxID=1962908 RepID=UPI0022BDFDA3|nr:DUF2490 domain-containing protein [Gemmatimonas sp.]MCZ8206030.1 DUF2490 domain-containing protein [Gemmatimonas sp.]
MPPISIRKGSALALLVALSAAPAGAQPWITRHQDALWVGAFVDEPITKRTALWFDGSWRRMDLGADPQQLLLRPGVQVTLAPGVRVAGGYAYIATAPYGNLPAATSTREHRSWQQISLSHRAGPFTMSHRYRLEQRWIHPLLAVMGSDDREAGPTAYQNRLRYMPRAQANLGSLTLQGRPLIGFVWDELLMPLGGGAQTFTIGQNRATVGVGVPLSPRVRAEVGYMNLYNALAARRANEVNHTLWLSWHWSGR